MYLNDETQYGNHKEFIIKRRCKGKGKDSGFKSWSHVGSHDFTIYCYKFCIYLLPLTLTSLILIFHKKVPHKKHHLFE